MGFNSGFKGLMYHVRLVGMKRSDGVESFRIRTLSLLFLLKVPPVYDTKAYGGDGKGVKLCPLSFLTSVLMGVVSFRPRPLNPGINIPSSH